MVWGFLVFFIDSFSLLWFNNLPESSKKYLFSSEFGNAKWGLNSPDILLEKLKNHQLLLENQNLLKLNIFWMIYFNDYYCLIILLLYDMIFFNFYYQLFILLIKIND